MATNVVMPQMGESVTEGTVTRWIKKVGDAVDRDEPLFEISTDKVDAEIPSPGAGVLTEIRVAEGETVAVDTVVAVIGGADTMAAAEATAAPAGPAARGAEADTASVVEPAPRASAETPVVVPSTPTPGPPPVPPSPEEDTTTLRRRKSSPLVRRIAKEHGIDVTGIRGTGLDGRVTKHDILRVVEAGGGGANIVAPAEVVGYRPVFLAEGVDVVPMSVMRKRIAEHMIHSRRTSAHVHSVIEVDFSRVAAIRASKKLEYERAGVKLTFLAFIAKAVVGALRKVPVINASIEDERVIYKRDVNLGIAVALDWGLIVPVVKRAHEKSLLTISREIADLAERARSKRLKPEDVQGGTFTITNPGGFGTMMGMPIINQPQVAILAVGAIEKRVVVVGDDAIAIRQRGLLTLGFDHRLVDGAVADAFLAELRRGLQHYDAAAD